MTPTITPEQLKERRRSKIVMAVDDSHENLDVLAAVITSAGYTFVGVPSGRECLDLVPRISPRLILLDIQMPEIDGLDVCRRLRTTPESRDVPIAFLTVSNTADDVRAGIEAGGNDFIIKPFDVEKLMSRIEHWTSRRL